jgi:hypothetical protein
MESPIEQQDDGRSPPDTANQTTIELTIPENLVIKEHVQCVDIPGRGRGLVTTRAFAANEQVLYINQPLSVNVHDVQLPHRCYYCLDLERDREKPLLRCSKCKEVKYCSEECQKLSWERRHKYECKLIRKYNDRGEGVKTHHRAAICLVRSIEHSRFSPQDNADLLALESHQADIRKEGDGWASFTSHASTIKEYTGTTLDSDLVHKLMCILMTNCLCLYDENRTRIGTVLHPLAAKINHSCQPNVYIRTDVSPGMSRAANPKPLLGSISIHAIRPIAAGEEITLLSQCFMGEPLPLKETRQVELQSRYFFTCDCTLCTAPGLPTSDDTELGDALELVRSLLPPRTQPPQTILIRQQMALGYRAALTALALTDAEYKAKGAYECPAQDIRFRLMSTISATHHARSAADLHLEAFLLNLLLVFRSDTAIDVTAQRPFNMSERLVLYHRAMKLDELVRGPAGVIMVAEGRSIDVDQLKNFIFMLVHELEEDANAALVARPDQPSPMMGLTEKTIFKLVEEFNSRQDRIAWSRYRIDQQANKAKAMKWVAAEMERQLAWEKEGAWWFPCTRRLKDVKSVGQECARIKRAIETGKQGVLMRALLGYEEALDSTADGQAVEGEEGAEAE